MKSWILTPVLLLLNSHPHENTDDASPLSPMNQPTEQSNDKEQAPNPLQSGLAATCHRVGWGRSQSELGPVKSLVPQLCLGPFLWLRVLHHSSALQRNMDIFVSQWSLLQGCFKWRAHVKCSSEDYVLPSAWERNQQKESSAVSLRILSSPEYQMENRIPWAYKLRQASANFKCRSKKRIMSSWQSWILADTFPWWWWPRVIHGGMKGEVEVLVAHYRRQRNESLGVISACRS